MKQEHAIVTLRCGAISCRVQTFTGVVCLPLNACPVCQTIGQPI